MNKRQSVSRVNSEAQAGDGRELVYYIIKPHFKDTGCSKVIYIIIAFNMLKKTNCHSFQIIYVNRVFLYKVA